MLGDRIDARRAMDLGILNRLVADDALESETTAFAHRLAKAPAVALKYIKENVQVALDGSLERALADGDSEHDPRCLTTEDSKDAVQAFKEKREPVFRGY